MDNNLLFTIATALVAIGVSWGIMEATNRTTRSDLEKLWKSHEDLQNDLDDVKERYVTNEHFKQIIRPLRDQMSEIGRDIKSIMTTLNRYDRT